MPDPEPVHVTRLEVKNVMGVRAVAVNFDKAGALVTIGGDNGAGKTSYLGALFWALQGRRSDPVRPLRDGTTTGTTIATLSNKMTLEWVVGKGAGICVRDAKGVPQAGPQALLNRLWSDRAFDADAFARAKPAEQLRVIRDLAGIDFSRLDTEHEVAFAARRDVNRDYRSLVAQVEALPHHDDAPDAEVSVAGLSEEVEKRLRVNQQNDRLRTGLVDTKARTVDMVNEANDLRRRIEELGADLEEKEGKIVHWKRDIEEEGARIGKLIDQDVNEVRERMNTAEADNQKVRHNSARVALQKECDAKRAERDVHEDELERIAAAKSAMIDGAKYPLPDLGFDDDGVTYKGHPLSDCATSEAMRISTAIGFALNPDLRVVRVNNGSLLDADSMREVVKVAEENQGQVFMEVVGDTRPDGEPVTVLIKDGTVATSDDDPHRDSVIENDEACISPAGDGEAVAP